MSPRIQLLQIEAHTPMHLLTKKDPIVGLVRLQLEIVGFRAFDGPRWIARN